MSDDVQLSKGQAEDQPLLLRTPVNVYASQTLVSSPTSYKCVAQWDHGAIVVADGVWQVCLALNSPYLFSTAIDQEAMRRLKLLPDSPADYAPLKECHGEDGQ